jgi:hypothetical protein
VPGHDVSVLIRHHAHAAQMVYAQIASLTRRRGRGEGIVFGSQLPERVIHINGVPGQADFLHALAVAIINIQLLATT